LHSIGKEGTKRKRDLSTMARAVHDHDADSSLSSSSFTIQAPGRLCLFGEHQDYLGLPVIAMAIPLYCRIQVQINEPITGNDDKQTYNQSHTNQQLGRRIIELRVPQLQQQQQSTIRLDLDQLPPRYNTNTDNDNNTTAPLTTVDFVLAAIHEVLEEGWNFSSSSSFHVTCTSTSDIPLQAGCSSSTAFCVAWILVLAQVASSLSKSSSSTSPSSLYHQLQQDPIRLAQLAHRVEVIHFGSPGGTMDHVTIALGCCGQDDPTNKNHTSTTRDDHPTQTTKVSPSTSGSAAVRIGPGMWQVERLPHLPQPQGGVWILADSGQSKDTLLHLKRCKNARLNLFNNQLHGSWDTPTSSIAIPLTSDQELLLLATKTNRDTEAQATALWMSYDASNASSLGAQLGALMDQHHQALRDGLHLSTPRFEAMNQAAHDAGAWGFKLVGSGGGGCAVAWTSRDTANQVAHAMEQAGAVATWMLC
jgi:galactokinase